MNIASILIPFRTPIICHAHLVVLASSLFLLAPSFTVRAQLAADSTTAAINGTGTNLTGTITIGTNGPFTTLIITNGGAVTNVSDGLGASEGRIGLNGGSVSNRVIITGAGSIWKDAQELYVGYGGSYNLLLVTNGGRMHNNGGHVGLGGVKNVALITGLGSVWTNVNSVQIGLNGSFNQMIVTNGGKVYADTADIGANAASRSNIVIVTDSGSLFTNSLGTSGLIVGGPGSFNQLLVTNGGIVANNGGYLANAASSSNNTVTITGAGSLWTNRFNLYAGQYGSFNHLVVSAGGTVVNGIGYLGYAPESSNNIATITGAGSLWNSRSDLHVGSSGSFNQLLATNGCLVTASNLYVGFDPASSNNSVSLAGGSIIITNSSGARITDVRRGTLALNYGLLRTDHLFITNGTKSQLAFFGGMLITRGGTVSNSLDFVVGGGAYPGVLEVRAGDPFVVYEQVYLGSNTPNNQLYITNGGTFEAVSSSASSIGARASGSNNWAVVSGAGSLWTNRARILIGEEGSSNQLHVTNSGTVRSAGGTMGTDSSSRGNLILIAGTNSVWKSSQNMHIGSSGAFNQLVVTNGGLMEGLNGAIGNSISSSNNLATITGVGSIWTNRAGIFVGLDGSFNRLVVSNGASLVVANDGYISANLSTNALGSNNTAIVTGAGSRWTNAFDLHMGDAGSFNRLTVSNGGAVINRNGGLHLGRSTASSNNVAWITDPNSVLVNNTTGGAISVGDFGSFNKLIVTNGASAISGNLYLGVEVSSSNNTAIVDGANLIVTNQAHTGVTDIRRGTLNLASGLMVTDWLLLTNGSKSVMSFFSGTLQTRETTVSGGAVFSLGFGGPVVELVGTGTHQFANGLLLPSAAVLKGNGTVIGNVTNAGTISPGASIGQLNMTGNLVLAANSTNVFELNKTLQTNDNIIGLASVTYGGTLALTNLSGTLGAGDSFKLFNASSYAGTFSSIVPPTPGAGLRWSTNALNANGTLNIVSLFPTISSITLSGGTNIVINSSGGTPFGTVYLLTSTNIAPPSANWIFLRTNVFNASGNASFTNAITPGEAQRYFCLQVE